MFVFGYELVNKKRKPPPRPQPCRTPSFFSHLGGNKKSKLGYGRRGPGEGGIKRSGIWQQQQQSKNVWLFLFCWSGSDFRDAVIAGSTRWLIRPGSVFRSHPDVAHRIPASLPLPACLPPPLRQSSPPLLLPPPLRFKNAMKEKTTTDEEGKWRAYSALWVDKIKAANTTQPHTPPLQSLNQM